MDTSRQISSTSSFDTFHPNLRLAKVCRSVPRKECFYSDQENFPEKQEYGERKKEFQKHRSNLMPSNSLVTNGQNGTIALYV